MNKGQGAIIRTNKTEAGGVTAADNGLSLAATTIQLGGPLIQNTAVDLAGAFTFEFDVNGANRGFFINPITNLFQLGDIDAIGNGLKLTIADAADIITFSDSAGDLFFVIDRGNFTYQFGDTSGLQNRSYLEIDDTNQRLRYLSGAGGFPYLDLNVGSGQYNYGDLGASGNQSNVTLSDTTQQFGFASGGVYYFFLDVGAGTYQMGDITMAANGTYFSINDTIPLVSVNVLGALNGFACDFLNYQFFLGDFAGQNNAVYIQILNSIQRITTNGTAEMIGTTTNFTNNAGAAAGTLLNAPVAGNPTKWIPIFDNGTIRNIPAW